ncbi:MAG: ankyrin repeat domain-containing protein [Lentisphaeria bacterium]|nr:ankyrin repeat domain-containing protein [Lentisphaeria bacterium]
MSKKQPVKNKKAQGQGQKPAPQQKTTPEKEVDNAVPRPLPGCLLPGCLLIFLIGGSLLYLASFCVMTARLPGTIPPEVYLPVNLLRFYSDEFYRLTEYLYRFSGGKEDPFVRGQSYTKFRAHVKNENGGRTVYRINEGFADVYQINRDGTRSDSERIVLPSNRAVFFHQMRTDGEYFDLLPVPGMSLYRKGRVIRKRTYPVALDKNTTVYNFDCNYVNNAPYTGWTMAARQDVNDPYRLRTATYLRGTLIENRFFPERGYYRGPEGYGMVKPEAIVLLEYEFGRNRMLFHQAADSHFQLLRLAGIRHRFQWQNGEYGLPDSLLRMAVRKADYGLLKKLLRHDLIRKELMETKRTPAKNAWSCLHDAAIQNDVRILAEIIPLYPDINLKETTWGATPFLAAVMADRKENVLLFLRRADKNVNQTLADGSTALHLAAETLSPVMAELLLAYGADKQKRNRAGDTPLRHLRKKLQHQGLDESHPDAAKLLTLLQ